MNIQHPGRGPQSNYFREPAPTKSTKPLYYIREILEPQIFTKKVNLGDVGIADDGCAILAELLEKQPEISSMDLRGNRITSHGLQKLIPSLKKIQNLENLALNWNDLENSNSLGMDNLAALVNLPGSTIKYLDLRNSNISHQSSNALESIIKAPNLRKIDLSWNNLGDLSSEAILRAVSYRMSDIEIELKGCMISDQKLKKITDSLYKLHSKFAEENERKKIF